MSEQCNHKPGDFCPFCAITTKPVPTVTIEHVPTPDSLEGRLDQIQRDLAELPQRVCDALAQQAIPADDPAPVKCSHGPSLWCPLCKPNYLENPNRKHTPPRVHDGPTMRAVPKAVLARTAEEAAITVIQQQAEALALAEDKIIKLKEALKPLAEIPQHVWDGVPYRDDLPTYRDIERAKEAVKL